MTKAGVDDNGNSMWGLYVQLIATWREGGFTENQEVRAQNIGFDGLLGGLSSGTDYEVKSLSIYPNPAGEYIRIQYDGSNIQSVCIIDILGQTVQSQLVNSRFPSIDVSGLKSGIYFIKVKTRDGKMMLVKCMKGVA